MAQQQLVEIARALSVDARVLILDEPTAVLSLHEQDNLFAIIARLKEAGLLVLYVSHRLDEIFTVADRVTVLRDGRKVATLDTHETSQAELVRLMIGHEVRDRLAPARSRTSSRCSRSPTAAIAGARPSRCAVGDPGARGLCRRRALAPGASARGARRGWRDRSLDPGGHRGVARSGRRDRGRAPLRHRGSQARGAVRQPLGAREHHGSRPADVRARGFSTRPCRARARRCHAAEPEADRAVARRSHRRAQRRQSAEGRAGPRAHARTQNTRSATSRRVASTLAPRMRSTAFSPGSRPPASASSSSRRR